MLQQYTNWLLLSKVYMVYTPHYYEIWYNYMPAYNTVYVTHSKQFDFMLNVSICWINWNKFIHNIIIITWVDMNLSKGLLKYHLLRSLFEWTSQTKWKGQNLTNNYGTLQKCIQCKHIDAKVRITDIFCTHTSI